MHVTVCILTYKRARFLDRLLKTLENQKTDGGLTYSVVVVDNDSKESGRPIVAVAQERKRIEVEYHLEPVQNLALARNRALSAAKGDFLAFIDDDEFPADDWLINLVRTAEEHKISCVMGPVLPHFEDKPASWVVRSGLFDRPRYPTRTPLAWNKTKTGNVLIRNTVFADPTYRFDPAFGVHSEDQDFFRRAMERGHQVIWCDTAVCYETQPPDRLTRMYMIRRALLRGSVAYKHPTAKARLVLKSLLALPAYTIALPFLLIAGDHWFMLYFVKNCDHLGRLLAAVGCPVEKRMKHI
jgi:succinoglycan biosynthesis protein ExoM